jgi:hypothetical protein
LNRRGAIGMIDGILGRIIAKLGPETNGKNILDVPGLP